MSESALRIADIPMATTTDFRPIWQDTAGGGPYVEWNGIRLRRGPTLIELEYLFRPDPAAWFVTFLLGDNRGRCAIANGGTFFNQAWELSQRKDSAAFRAFAAACPMTAQLVSTSHGTVGEISAMAARMPTPEIADGAPILVTVLTSPEDGTPLNETLSLADLDFMCHPAQVAAGMIEEMRNYYIEIGQQLAMQQGPKTGSWLEAGVAGLETVNELLKLVNRAMGRS